MWDAISARTVADVPGTRALATASHSIAATLGYPDGERIPRRGDARDVPPHRRGGRAPVSADLEGGYGDAPDTIRRAIGFGVVGANIEDQLKPLAEAAAQVEAVMAAAAAEGVPDFVLNARTDAFVKAGDRDPADVLADAVGAAGRTSTPAPRWSSCRPPRRAQVTTLVDALGPQRLTLIGVPGSLSLAGPEELGVARVSLRPQTQRVALTALQELVEDVQRRRWAAVPR